MTKKEFITELLKQIDIKVKRYSSECIKCEKGGVEFGIEQFSDVNSKAFSLKLKSYNYSFTVQDERVIRAFCMETGLAVTVDTYKVVGNIAKNKMALRLKGQVTPWNQTAKPMTDDEVIEDALTEQKRYRPVGYFGEDEEDSTCIC